MRLRAMRWIPLAALVWAIAISSRSAAQDFTAPAPATPNVGTLGFLERGLPPAGGGVRLEACATRWFGIPDLATRSVAAGLGFGAFRGACGLSQTGDTEVGWNALGLALGASRAQAGAALRCVARRDRRVLADGSPLGDGSGAEAGGAAWVAAGRCVRLWAASPQLWKRGIAPPLARGLEIGIAFEAEPFTAWWTRLASPRLGALDADHAAGIALGGGSHALWLEARDHPLRGGAGFAGRVARLGASIEVRSHPVLGETVAISLAISMGAR